MVFGNEWKVSTHNSPIKTGQSSKLRTALCWNWYIISKSIFTILGHNSGLHFLPGVIRTLKCPIQFIIGCLCCSSLCWPSQGWHLLTSFHVNKGMIMSYSTGTQHTFFYTPQSLILPDTWVHRGKTGCHVQSDFINISLIGSILETSSWQVSGKVIVWRALFKVLIKAV